MPYPFSLPTTSFLSFADHFQCSSHPALPFQATITRGVLRAALKAHRRLPPPQKPAHLPTVLAALQAYLPYLHALLNGLAQTSPNIQLTLVRELEVSWRSALTPPRRGAPRIKVQGLASELAFTLHTLAATHCLLARASLHSLADRHAAGGAPAPEQRAAAIAAAMKHLLDAHAAATFAAARAPPAPPEIASGTAAAIAAAALAEATALAVLKDDPFAAAAATARAVNDRSWMVADAALPKVRAHLFARLCLAAAEHAARGTGLLSSGGRTPAAPDLARYIADLRRASRAKACRFLSIDAEGSGETGTALAWLDAARIELGDADSIDAGGGTGFAARIRRDWSERREDRRIERGAAWGADAGRADEARIVDGLAAKWRRMNDTVGVQVVPPAGPLLASLPSGREYHAPKAWGLPALEPAELAGMRAMPDGDARRAAAAAGVGGGEDDSDEDTSGDAPGAFPDGERENYF